MKDKIITITKVSDTEIEITETIPEKIIPAVENKTIVSVFDLKSQIDTLNAERDRQVSYLTTPQEEINKINARIADIDTQKANIQARIDEAISQGVQDPTEIVGLEPEPVIIN